MIDKIASILILFLFLQTISTELCHSSCLNCSAPGANSCTVCDNMYLMLNTFSNTCEPIAFTSIAEVTDANWVKNDSTLLWIMTYMNVNYYSSSSAGWNPQFTLFE